MRTTKENKQEEINDRVLEKGGAMGKKQTGNSENTNNTLKFSL